MKIVLSRKGFDSESGGQPSPILPDGTLTSLPIPDFSRTSSIRYADIRGPGRASLGPIVEDLTHGKLSGDHFAHLDPDLRSAAYPRNPGWRPLFGQAGGDQTHLAKHHVGVGDLFLFFGWFRRVEFVNNTYRFVRNAPDLHVIFGWLQIDSILTVGTTRVPRWAEYHHHFHPPSASGNWSHNTVYVSSPRLLLNGVAQGTPGGGIFNMYRDELCLTCPDQPYRTVWKLPLWFYPAEGRSPLSRHHALNRWRRNGGYVILKSVSRGQELVLNADEYPEAISWVQRLTAMNAA